MKIRITTESDTLFGTSGGSALIDSTTQHYSSGIPFIPAKTIKGLLRESAMEVLEMTGNGNKKSNWISSLFGEEGTGGEGQLTISSGDVLDDKGKKYKKIRLQDYGFSSDEVLDYFTLVRSQTRLKAGVAAKGSLRNMRALRPGLQFTCQLIGSLEDDDKALLFLSCLNLRRSGTSRTRGLGKIKVKMEEIDLSISDALRKVNNFKPNDHREKETPDHMPSFKEASKSSFGEIETRNYRITFLSPVLLPAGNTDANTVTSEEHISGRKILGMLAAAYLKKRPVDETFVNLFLSGQVRFESAYPFSNGETCFPLGRHWAYKKNDPGKKVFNDYKIEQKDNRKVVSGYYSKKGNKAKTIQKVLDFHNSRNRNEKTRLAGRNIEEGIYYYESLAEGQKFHTRISGPFQLFEELDKLMKGELRLGKATTTNHGQVEMKKIKPEEKYGIKQQNAVFITFVSPVILRDKNTLEYDPSLKNLKSAMGDIDISRENSRIRRSTDVVFQGKIKMQLPEIPVIAPGSSVYVKTVESSLIKKWMTEGIGEKTHEGYGKVLIELDTDDKGVNISNSLQENQKKKKENTKGQVDDNSQNALIKHILQNRKILQYREKALNNTLRIEHKNTVKLMIDLFKDLSRDSENTETFTYKKLKELPKKVNETLENDFNVKGDKLANKFLEKLDKEDKGNVSYLSAYWLEYFTQQKLENRKDDKQ